MGKIKAFLNGNISDVVVERGRIISVVIFIIKINFQYVSYVFIKIVQWETTI